MNRGLLKMLTSVWVGTFLLTFSTPAAAFWGWLIATVGAALGIGAAAATVVVAVIAVVAIVKVKNYVDQAGDMPEFPETGSQGILINKTGSTQAIPIIYGETRTGGTRVLTQSTGTDNVDLHVVYVIGEGEMNKCSAIYFDGEEAATCSTTGSTDPSAWTINSPWSDTTVDIYFRVGTDSQIAITDLDNAKTWTGSPDFKGIAYVYMKLTYNEEVWTNGLPTVTFDVQGVKVPETSDGTTMSYSHNPARCILDYLTNTRYGKAIPVGDLDLSTFATAETYCGNVGFECRGNLVPSATLYGNLLDLLTSCRANLTFGNKYRLMVDSPNSVVSLDITDANTIGNVQYVLATKNSMFNKLTAKYINELTEYKDDILTIESSTLQTEDNGLILEFETAFPYVKTESVVNRLLTEEINQSRQGHRLSLTITIEGMNLEVGDIVTVTNETFGITEKKFRVLSTEITSEHNVILELQEYDPNVYGTEIITNARDDDND